MFHKIVIKNFRGITNLEMNGVTPFTLVTGKNNVGKSSILEALFLYHDHYAPSVFGVLSNVRGGFVEPNVQLWNPLFNQMNAEKTMEIILEYEDGKTGKLAMEKDANYIMSQDQMLNPVLVSGIRPDYVLRFDYEHGDYRETGYFTATESGIGGNVSTSLPMNEREKMPWTIYINSSNPRISQDVAEWIGRLEINENKQVAVDILRTMEPSIRDVFVASQNGQTQLYIKDSRGVIPLKYAGDGLVRILYMTAAILSNPNSLILLDEIENGFHYSMYKNLLSILGKVANENHCQVIATTHSYEVIAEGISGIVDEEIQKQFSLHRLEQAEGGLRDNCFDYEMVETAIKSNWEVR